MRLTIQVREKNSAHVVFAVFANGGLCGKLVMRVDEFRDLQGILRAGAGPAQSTVAFGEDIISKPTEDVEAEDVEADETVEIDIEKTENEVVDYLSKPKKKASKRKGGD